MAIAFVPIINAGAGVSTLSIAPTNVGDGILFVTSVNSTSISATALNSTNIVWDSSSGVTYSGDGVHTLQLWKGVATSTATATVTVSWSSTIGTTYSELAAMGVHSSASCTWQWLSGQNGGTTGTAVTTYTWPTLTSGSGDLGEAYFGYVANNQTAVAGTTSGFTYNIDSNGNMEIYNLNLSSNTAYTPNGNATPSATYSTIGAILQAIPLVSTISIGTGVPSAEYFSSAQINTLQPDSIPSLETWSNPQISTIIATNIASSETFGSPSLPQLVGLVTSITSFETFGTPQISILQPNPIVSSETWSSPQISIVQPNSIASNEIFGSPSLPGLIGLIASITSSETFDSSQISTIQPNSIISSEAWSSPQINTIVNPTPITSAEIFGLPSLPQLIGLIASISSSEIWPNLQINTLQPNEIISNEAFGSLQINIIYPTNIASSETFGFPTLSGVIYPDSITSSEGFGISTISTLQPSPIITSEFFEVPQINTILSPTNILSSETFGLLTTQSSIWLNSINSSETFGTSQINVLQPDDIPSLEAFGNLQINFIQPSPIISSETFELPTIVFAGGITPFSIDSSEIFDSPQINIIQPNSIASFEAWGLLQINTIQPNSINSSETFDLPQQINLISYISSINSSETFGSLQINIITPTSIVSSEAVDFPTIVFAGGVIPLSIDSSEIFDPPQINIIQSFSIDSSETFGLSQIAEALPSINIIYPNSISTAEVWGIWQIGTISSPISIFEEIFDFPTLFIISPYKPSKVPKQQLGPLNLIDADIASTGIDMEVLSMNGNSATDGQYLMYSVDSGGWIPSDFPASPAFIDAEIPSGTIDSSNKVFTLAGTPTGNSLRLIIGGMLMTPGTAGDYTINGNIVTFTDISAAPDPNDSMLAYYRS